MTAILERIDSEEKRRYIAEHAPGILRALIMRRASTDPHTLIESAIETASILYDQISPTIRRNGNGREEAVHPN
jgi:hypothetical protein